VRKVFSSDNHAHAYPDFVAELRNMSRLKMLKHPNILPLLVAYSYRYKYNFLFPRAQGGDLQELLNSEIRPPEFQSTENLVIALAGLSSGIRAMHNFDTEQLKLIGCHRDLKPANVLLHESSFVLADFGVSRFRDITETSSSMYVSVRGDYTAPECEDINGNFEKFKIRRSSDIWSFGCLILELMTHMIYGKKGVEEFHEKRKSVHQAGKYVHYMFHGGPGRSNDGVQSWLEKMQQGCKETQNILAGLQDMLLLARWMLALRPKERPRASEVETHLCYISTYVMANPIRDGLDSLYKQDHSIPALIEQRQFDCWLAALNVLDRDNSGLSREKWTEQRLPEFEAIRNHLLRFRNLLTEMKFDDAKPVSGKFAALRHLNHALHTLLPSALQEEARQRFEIVMLDYQGDRAGQFLKDLSLTLESRASDSRLGTLAAMKRIQILTRNRKGPAQDSSRIDPASWREIETVQGFRVVEKTGGLTKIKELMLVEARMYDVTWADERVGTELLARLENVAQYLSAKPKPDTLAILHCRGFFHEPSQCSVGLVYDFPCIDQTKAQLEEFLTLHQLLEDVPEHKFRPMLGDRFRLAHTLAQSLLELHKSAWLHRRISARNIALFHKKGSDADSLVFAILGFAQSRRDEDDAYTEGRVGHEEEQSYYHDPHYLKPGQRFMARHDCYALGMVLLEIGFWRLISNILKSRSITIAKEEEFTQYVVEVLVPELGHHMGAVYRDAVLECFAQGIESAADVRHIQQRDNSLARQIRFQQLVLNRLATCTA
jgi:serine/threonine protein kinase